MNFKVTFLTMAMIIFLTSCENVLKTSTPLVPITTPENHLATSSIELTAIPVDIEPKKGVFHAQTAKDWTLYWDAGQDIVSSFTFGQNNSVWLGDDGGVVKRLIHLDLDSGSYTEYGLDQAYDITTIRIDKTEGVWIGNPSYRLTEGKWTFFGANSLYPQISPDNSVWAKYINSPFPDCPARYDQDKWTEFCPPYKDNEVRMYHFLIDRSGSIWVSTIEDNYSQGVWKLSDVDWQIVEELGDDKELPYIMAQGPTGDLWFVSSKTSLSQKENGRIKQFDGKKWLVDIENPADTTGMTIGNNVQVDENNVPWIYAIDNKDEYILKLNNNQWDKMVSGNELQNIWGTSVEIYSFGFNPSGNLCLGTNLGFMCKTK